MNTTTGATANTPRHRVPIGPVLAAALLVFSIAVGRPATAQISRQRLAPPGRLIELGGYRMHLWCTGPARSNQPTVVLSIGGGGFAVDWSLVQRPLSDSNRVCSYDRPGFGWSDPGPYPRTLLQEAHELYGALQKGGERPPYVLVGQSLGAFVVRQFALDHRQDVAGMVLVEPANENGKLGYRGQFVLPRMSATARPIPPAHGYAESPPRFIPRPDCDSNRVRAERSARIVRPFDQLDAQAQRYRVWALSHPSCVLPQDDYFAEEMAAFFSRWAVNPHPLGDMPLIVIAGTQRRVRPPGLSEADWRSDSLRIDLSKLSQQGKLVADSLSGHHVQLDNPRLVVESIREVLAKAPRQ